MRLAAKGMERDAPLSLLNAIRRSTLFTLAVLIAAAAWGQESFAFPAGLTPKIERQVKSFLGTAPKGHQCLDREEPLYTQAIEQMRLPDRPFARKIAKNAWLLSGGKPHDYGDSTAIIYSDGQRIRAVAITACDWVKLTKVNRARKGSIYLYVDSISRKKYYLSLLSSWRAFDRNIPISVTPIKSLRAAK